MMITKKKIRLTVDYYRHFDADFARAVPAEGYGGWQKTEIELDLAHTAVVIMHAWDTGTREQYPGWYRCVEYLPRAQEILRKVFPPLVAAVRRSGMPFYHVVAKGKYYRQYPGFQRALRLAGPESVPEQAKTDPALESLRSFRSEHVFVGRRNQDDVKAGFSRLDFPPEARPEGEEGIAENAAQLFALCKADGVNHLVYAGFAVNWCLLMSSGGMLDMSRHGIMCSVIRQAVTAVENKESARLESHKEEALWRIALAFGFVFDLADLIAVLCQGSDQNQPVRVTSKPAG
ncbi:MAG: isochorismatase family protein [Kiritimatiellae bacterium]|nr:isochorismatase family protein [Kiritimatiellia bacterium]